MAVSLPSTAVERLTEPVIAPAVARVPVTPRTSDWLAVLKTVALLATVRLPSVPPPRVTRVAWLSSPAVLAAVLTVVVAGPA